MSAPTAGLPALLRPGAPWRNWSGAVRATPAHLASPGSVEEVVDVVRRAAELGLAVKAVGAGHSFTPVAATDGVLVDLSRLRGVVGVDAERRRVRLRAGTRLWELPRLLGAHGLAMANLGDIDRQTIAGATSTGTHGTGAGFTGLAGQLTGVTLVTGTGGVLRVDETSSPDLLPAVALGLGALGVVVEVEVQCVPRFLLHAVEGPAPWHQVLDAWPDLSTRTDHVECFWWPHTDRLMMKANTRRPWDASHEPPPRLRTWVEERLLENEALRAMQALAHRAPRATPALNRLATRSYGHRELTAPSHEVFTSPRLVRFRESEYAVPAEAVPAALRELRRVVEARNWPISLPVEVRTAAADDLWLSTAHGRATGYLAVHRYHRDDPTAYFRAFEDVVHDHGGRPHWGKEHGLDAAALSRLYPRFGDFVAVRDRLDPDRRFANDYLRRVLGD